MEEFLRYVISSLIDHPDELVISPAEIDGQIVFHVAARKSDIPKIIGKGGHTIQALRSLLAASAAKTNTQVKLEIIE